VLKRELQPTYLMQWSVMKWCIKHGITSYDMVGVPNRDEVGTGNSRDGLFEFKSKFNPEITEFIGAWDLPLSALYPAWGLIGERLAGRDAMKRPEKFLY
jgi:lipid II:glycine glycyltransferase (peptidoglycan interpeptide bridge formation enzyme)